MAYAAGLGPVGGDTVGVQIPPPALCPSIPVGPGAEPIGPGGGTMRLVARTARRRPLSPADRPLRTPEPDPVIGSGFARAQSCGRQACGRRPVDLHTNDRPLTSAPRFADADRGQG